MPQLNRKEMEAVIASGGSVLYGGRTIAHASQLPSEADLAKGDPEAETAAANALQQQIADLQAQVAKLTPAPDSKADAKAKADADAKAKADADAKAKAGS